MARNVSYVLLHGCSIEIISDLSFAHDDSIFRDRNFGFRFHCNTAAYWRLREVLLFIYYLSSVICYLLFIIYYLFVYS